MRDYAGEILANLDRITSMGHGARREALDAGVATAWIDRKTGEMVIETPAQPRGPISGCSGDDAAPRSDAAE